MLRSDWPFCLLAIASLGLTGLQARGQNNAVHPAADGSFPGYAAARPNESFPGVPAQPIARKPLSEPPAVLALEHRQAAQMQAPDAALVDSRREELAHRARMAGFDISAGWQYEQIVCPAFPDYLLLRFSPSVEKNGSPRFVAVLERNSPWMRIVSAVSVEPLPLGLLWPHPGAYEVFNSMLRRERGLSPLGSAPAWLSIAMCYAELSGHGVQVLTSEPLPDSTLDLSRLDANQPQMRIDPDQSAEVTFSDASRPAVTTTWLLRFNPRGQILSVSRSGEHQPAKIALKP